MFASFFVSAFFRRASIRAAALGVAGAFMLGRPLLATPVINEIMASNATTLADDDGDYSDWIEIHNPDASPVNLNGWYLTDKASKPKKWKFPAVTIPAGGYLVVFASGKDRADPTRPLHTSFKLSADGDYLGFYQADGATVASEFTPGFPAQFTDISYGRTEPTNPSEPVQTGYFAVATPGARNGDASSLTLGELVAFSRPSGLFTGQIQVELSGAVSGEKIRYVAAAPSASGASVADPTAASTEYTGPITVSDPTIIRAAVFSADNSRHGAATSMHYLRVDDSTANRLDTFSSQLPLIVMDDHGLGPLVKDNIDHPSFFYGFAPGAGGTASVLDTPAHSSASLMSVRGESSSGFPKKGFKFDLVQSSGRDNPQPLFGLGSFESWNVVGPWYFDPSFIRNAIAYGLSNKAGRWAARTQMTELFFKNDGTALNYADYNGVYILTDKIEEDPNRVAITKLSAADTSADTITGGYILKIDEPDPEKYSWRTTRGYPTFDYESSVLMVESPKLAKLAPAQRDYIQNYVQSAEDALYADQAAKWKTHTYLNYIDRASWVDHHLLNVFFKNTDAFWRSAYLTKDRGGKLVAGPIWDFDRSMDSADPRDDNFDTWEPTKNTAQGAAMPYWEFGWWGVLAQDPDFMQAWVDRWQSLRAGEFVDEKLVDMVTGLANQVGGDAAARDAAHWHDDMSAQGSYAAETKHVQDWLVKRAQWIDTQFVAPAAAGAQGQLVRVAPAKGAKLAYTLDGTDPRLSGGALSASAKLTDGELLVVDASQVRVRSYRADQIDKFPGSPWSRLIIPSTDHGSAGSDGLPALSQEVSADLGQSLTLGLKANVLGSVTYQWAHDGVIVAGANQSTLALTSLSSTDIGTYTLTISNGSGALTTIAYTLAVSADLHLSNLSSRASVGTGSDVLIGGFVVDSASPRKYLLRAIGPALADYGVGQPLMAPTLNVFDSAGNLLATNTGWETGPDPAGVADAARLVGAFALTAGRKDSALVMELPSGVYSMHAVGANGGTGVGLAEIYALDDAGTPVNLSSRARVRPGENVLIAGLVVTGTNPRHLLIRGVGPALSGFGVSDFLADPVVQIVQNGAVLYENDNWGTVTDPSLTTTTSARVGAFPLAAGSADAALVVDLPPGVYSVIVKGKGTAEGVALVEIYGVR